MDNRIINLTDYTILQHVFFALGCLLWVVTYIIVISAIRRKQFVEIPVVAVSANFAWEFLWSFFFITDMGLLYVWGYRIWFFLDCFIFLGLLHYGYKQMALPQFRSIAKPLTVALLAAWIFMLYFYIRNYDYPISHNGAYSGYILNVMMSALYIPAFLTYGKTLPFNTLAAWCKGIGTLFITVFCFLRYDDWFLLSMCVVTTLLDASYIYAIMRKPASV